MKKPRTEQKCDKWGQCTEETHEETMKEQQCEKVMKSREVTECKRVPVVKKEQVCHFLEKPYECKATEIKCKRFEEKPEEGKGYNQEKYAL